VEQTGCSIVLSTDWRRFREGRLEVKRALSSFGMDFIGCTPLSRSRFVAERPAEILKWIHTYDMRAKKENLEPVTHFVAIDDRDLLTEVGGQYMRGHFVKTKLRIGLNRERAEAAVQALQTAIQTDFSDNMVQHSPNMICGSKPAYASRSWKPPRLSPLASSGKALADQTVGNNDGGAQSLPRLTPSPGAELRVSHQMDSPSPESMAGPSLPKVTGSSNSIALSLIKPAYQTRRATNRDRFQVRGGFTI